MKRPLSRIEHFQRILRTLGSRCAAAYAVKHLMAVSGKGVYDTHDYNVMKRRKKYEFVLVDCFLQ